MSNTVNMIRVEKYFSQFEGADKLSRLDIQSCRVENASHKLTRKGILVVESYERTSCLDSTDRVVEWKMNLTSSLKQRSAQYNPQRKS